MTVHTYQFHIGDIEAAVISDEIQTMPEERFNRIFNSDDGAEIRAAFTQLAEAPGFSRNCLYLRTPTQHILVDTGEGQHQDDVKGRLMEGLETLGVSPEQIDVIIITHFHLDHIWGMIDPDGGLVFPNARVVVPLNEWNHWRSDAFMATLDETRVQALRRAFDPYVEAGRLDKIDDDREIVPGIRYVPMVGHTPGHAGLSIVSGEARLLHIADTAHLPLQLQYMDAPPRFDFDEAQAASTRRAVFERAHETGDLLLVYHFAFPGLGHVIQPEGDFYWQPYEPDHHSGAL